MFNFSDKYFGEELAEIFDEKDFIIQKEVEESDHGFYIETFTTKLLYPNKLTVDNWGEYADTVLLPELNVDEVYEEEIFIDDYTLYNLMDVVNEMEIEDDSIGFLEDRKKIMKLKKNKRFVENFTLYAQIKSIKKIKEIADTYPEYTELI